MKAFAYARPPSIEEALALLRDGPGGGTALLAGGSDLLSRMKDRIAEPGFVVSLGGIEELAGITEAGGFLRIGGGTTLADLQRSSLLASRFPALLQAVARIGSPQVRNVATLAGNLLQRPRCWYFRQEFFSCRKKGGEGCPAIEGDHRHHAILGDPLCPIVHPSSLAVPLVAHDARLDLAGTAGERSVPAAAFFLADPEKPLRENGLRGGEILVAARLPMPPAGTAAATYEARQRLSHDWPLALATAVLQREGETVREARVVLGHVAPIPWRSRAAEKVLAGGKVTVERAAEAARRALEEAHPLPGNRHKVPVARAVVRRAVLRAAGMLDEEEA